MKKLFSLLFLFMALSGCKSLTTQDNIINFLSAPKLNQNESEVVRAISEYTNRNINLKYPKSGGNASPVNIVDIDNDGTNEAVVFYSARSIGGNVRMAVLTQTEKGWIVTDDSEGFGTEIYKADFESFSDKKQKNIAVGYTFSDSSEKLLSVYTLNGKTVKKTDTYSCQDYTICDVTGDRAADIIIAGNNAEEQVASIAVISLINTNFITMAKAELDTTNAKVTNIALTKTENGGNAVLVDYSDPYKFVHTEVFEYTKGKLEQIMSGNTVVKEWAQAYNLISIDTDKDGFFETPTIITDSTSIEKTAKFMEWTCFYIENPERKLFGVCETEKGIFIPIPDEWQNYITVSKNEDGSYIFSSVLDSSALFTMTVYTSRVPSDIDSGAVLVSIGTMQIAFTFGENTSPEQIKYITENVIYLK